MLDFSNKASTLPKALALIDGDIVQYTIGHACQSVYYVVGDEVFAKLSEAKEFCTAATLNPDTYIEKVVQAEPLEDTLKALDDFLDSILGAVNAELYEIYLSGRDNYRHKIDTIAPYKGNRTQDKPIHHKEIRHHLLERWFGVEASGKEADDLLGLNQSEETIICTIDKDLDMVAGRHYNWNRGEIYSVTPEEGIHSFYMQLLTGDRSDNIKGIVGIGPVKAQAILEDCKTEREHYEACLQAYKDAGQDYYDLLETANLLWIQQKGRETWLPPEK